MPLRRRPVVREESFSRVVNDDGYYLQRMREILDTPPRVKPPANHVRLCDHVFMGSQRNAEDIESLRNDGIAYVLSCVQARRSGDSPYGKDSGIRGFLLIPAEDREDFDIQRFFEGAIKFLECVREEPGGHAALVHCNLGVNRSGAVVAAYLMVSQRRNLLNVVQDLKTRRHTVLTNRGFRRQLIQFAREKGLLDPIVDTVTRITYYEPVESDGGQLDSQREAESTKSDKSDSDSGGEEMREIEERGRLRELKESAGAIIEEDDKFTTQHLASSTAAALQTSSILTTLAPMTMPAKHSLSTSVSLVPMSAVTTSSSAVTSSAVTSSSSAVTSSAIPSAKTSSSLSSVAPSANESSVMTSSAVTSLSYIGESSSCGRQRRRAAEPSSERDSARNIEEASGRNDGNISATACLDDSGNKKVNSSTNDSNISNTTYRSDSGNKSAKSFIMPLPEIQINDCSVNKQNLNLEPTEDRDEQSRRRQNRNRNSDDRPSCRVSDRSGYDDDPKSVVTRSTCEVEQAVEEVIKSRPDAQTGQTNDPTISPVKLLKMHKVGVVKTDQPSRRFPNNDHIISSLQQRSDEARQRPSSSLLDDRVRVRTRTAVTLDETVKPEKANASSETKLAVNKNSVVGLSDSLKSNAGTDSSMASGCMQNLQTAGNHLTSRNGGKAINLNENSRQTTRINSDITVEQSAASLGKSGDLRVSANSTASSMKGEKMKSIFDEKRRKTPKYVEAQCTVTPPIDIKLRVLSVKITDNVNDKRTTVKNTKSVKKNESKNFQSESNGSLVVPDLNKRPQNSQNNLITGGFGVGAQNDESSCQSDAGAVVENISTDNFSDNPNESNTTAKLKHSSKSGSLKNEIKTTDNSKPSTGTERNTKTNTSKASISNATFPAASGTVSNSSTSKAINSNSDNGTNSKIQIYPALPANDSRRIGKLKKPATDAESKSIENKTQIFRFSPAGNSKVAASTTGSSASTVKSNTSSAGSSNKYQAESAPVAAANVGNGTNYAAASSPTSTAAAAVVSRSSAGTVVSLGRYTNKTSNINGAGAKSNLSKAGSSSSKAAAVVVPSAGTAATAETAATAAAKSGISQFAIPVAPGKISTNSIAREKSKISEEDEEIKDESKENKQLLSQTQNIVLSKVDNREASRRLSTVENFRLINIYPKPIANFINSGTNGRRSSTATFPQQQIGNGSPSRMIPIEPRQARYGSIDNDVQERGDRYKSYGNPVEFSEESGRFGRFLSDIKQSAVNLALKGSAAVNMAIHSARIGQNSRSGNDSSLFGSAMKLPYLKTAFKGSAQIPGDASRGTGTFSARHERNSLTVMEVMTPQKPPWMSGKIGGNAKRSDRFSIDERVPENSNKGYSDNATTKDGNLINIPVYHYNSPEYSPEQYPVPGYPSDTHNKHTHTTFDHYPDLTSPEPTSGGPVQKPLSKAALEDIKDQLRRVPRTVKVPPTRATPSNFQIPTLRSVSESKKKEMASDLKVDNSAFPPACVKTDVRLVAERINRVNEARQRNVSEPTRAARQEDQNLPQDVQVLHRHVARNDVGDYYRQPTDDFSISSTQREPRSLSQRPWTSKYQQIGESDQIDNSRRSLPNERDRKSFIGNRIQSQTDLSSGVDVEIFATLPKPSRPAVQQSIPKRLVDQLDKAAKRHYSPQVGRKARSGNDQGIARMKHTESYQDLNDSDYPIITLDTNWDDRDVYSSGKTKFNTHHSDSLQREYLKSSNDVGKPDIPSKELPGKFNEGNNRRFSSYGSEYSQSKRDQNEVNPIDKTLYTSSNQRNRASFPDSYGEPLEQGYMTNIKDQAFTKDIYIPKEVRDIIEHYIVSRQDNFEQGNDKERIFKDFNSRSSLRKSYSRDLPDQIYRQYESDSEYMDRQKDRPKSLERLIPINFHSPKYSEKLEPSGNMTLSNQQRYGFQKPTDETEKEELRKQSCTTPISTSYRSQTPGRMLPSEYQVQGSMDMYDRTWERDLSNNQQRAASSESKNLSNTIDDSRSRRPSDFPATFRLPPPGKCKESTSPISPSRPQTRRTTLVDSYPESPRSTTSPSPNRSIESRFMRAAAAAAVAAATSHSETASMDDGASSFAGSRRSSVSSAPGVVGISGFAVRPTTNVSFSRCSSSPGTPPRLSRGLSRDNDDQSNLPVHSRGASRDYDDIEDDDASYSGCLVRVGSKRAIASNLPRSSSFRNLTEDRKESSSRYSSIRDVPDNRNVSSIGAWYGPGGTWRSGDSAYIAASTAAAAASTAAAAASTAAVETADRRPMRPYVRSRTDTEIVRRRP